jgi:hypothetical protein
MVNNRKKLTKTKLMTEQCKLKFILPLESNERRKRLINLTARLVTKMLDQQAQLKTEKGGQAHEQ